MPEDFLLPADVGRLANRTPGAVQAAVDRGELPALRTPRGVRLIRRDDAEAYAAKALTRDVAKRAATVAAA